MKDMTPRANRILQRRNKANFKAYYERKKNGKPSNTESIKKTDTKFNQDLKKQTQEETKSCSPKQRSHSAINRSRTPSPQPGPSRRSLRFHSTHSDINQKKSSETTPNGSSHIGQPRSSRAQVRTSCLNRSQSCSSTHHETKEETKSCPPNQRSRSKINRSRTPSLQPGAQPSHLLVVACAFIALILILIRKRVTRQTQMVLLILDSQDLVNREYVVLALIVLKVIVLLQALLSVYAQATHM